MGTTADKLAATLASKAAIKAAIENKGVEVGIAPLREYAGLIDGIETVSDMDIIASDQVASASKQGQISSVTPTKVAEFTMKAAGSIRVMFNIRSSSSGAAGIGRIYKNGTAIGTTRSARNEGATFTEDFAGIVVGDKIQAYINANDFSTTAYIKDFKICGSLIFVVAT